MLTITIPSAELFNEETSEITFTEEVEVRLEHSLVSLSKWESIYEKPFLSEEKKTPEEVIAYIEAMVVNDDFDPKCLKLLTHANLEAINTYIESPCSATTFGEMPKKPGRAETITSELIYYWLVAFQIPFQPTETWHLNRLFSLVRVANIKNSKPEPKSAAEQAQYRREMNMKRRKEMGSKG